MRQSPESVRQARAERYLKRARELYIGKPGETGFVKYDLHKALINVKRALMLTPKSYDSLVLIGNIIGELDESEDGLRTVIGYYDKAISLQPENPDAHGAKAAACFDAQEFTMAVTPAWKAWRLTIRDPNADEFDVKVAGVYLRDTLVKLGKWKTACTVLERALKRVPGDDWLVRMLDLTKKGIEWAPPDDPGPPKRLRRVK
jgi:tetratricopeptide (TPR) repeat protein